jgi:hypothetical protein
MTDDIIERICGKLFGHKYQAQELRFSAILNQYGKTYEICSICGKRRFLGWKHSLSDPDYVSLEDDGISWENMHP